jgi:hypothetical protein
MIIDYIEENAFNFFFTFILIYFFINCSENSCEEKRDKYKTRKEMIHKFFNIKRIWLYFFLHCNHLSKIQFNNTLRFTVYVFQNQSKTFNF